MARRERRVGPGEARVLGYPQAEVTEEKTCRRLVMRQLKYLAVAMLILVPSGAALADDLTGATELICSAERMTLCAANGECSKCPRQP